MKSVYLTLYKNGRVKTWITFSDLKKLTQSAVIKSQTEWFRYWKENKRPRNIPSNPHKIYKEWKSWADFLGTDNFSTPRKYISYHSLKKFCRKQKIKSQSQFYKFWKTRKRPLTIPTKPYYIYKEWKSWADFLGTDNIATQRKKFISLSYLKKFCRTNNIQSQLQYREYWETHTKPKNIPFNPDQVYKKKWKNWYDLTGVKRRN